MAAKRVWRLRDGSVFMYNPPASRLPVSLPHRSVAAPEQQDLTGNEARRRALENPFLFATSTSTSAHLMDAEERARVKAEALLPPLRRSRGADEGGSKKHLDETQLAALRTARAAADPFSRAGSRKALAKAFGLSAAHQQVVGTLGYGKGKEAREAAKRRKAAHDARNWEQMANWGWRKQIVHEERVRRRAMW